MRPPDDRSRGSGLTGHEYRSELRVSRWRFILGVAIRRSRNAFNQYDNRFVRRALLLPGRDVSRGKGLQAERAFFGKISNTTTRSTRVPSKYFRKHLRSHIKPVKCHMCHHAAAEQRDMRRHVEHAHNAWAKRHGMMTKDPSCQICGVSFTRKDNLQRHHRNKHADRLG